MRFFSSLSCFGGRKNRRLDPSLSTQSLPVQAQDKDSLPGKVSAEADVAEQDAVHGAAGTQPEAEDAAITSMPEPAPPADVKPDLFRLPAITGTILNEDDSSKVSSAAQRATTNPESPTATATWIVPPNPPPDSASSLAPTRSSSNSVGSSHSKSSGPGYSLNQKSTKATTPPQTAGGEEATPISTAQVCHRQSRPESTADGASPLPGKGGAGPETKTVETSQPPTLNQQNPPAPIPADLLKPVGTSTIKPSLALTTISTAGPVPSAATTTTTTTTTGLGQRRPSYEDDTPISTSPSGPRDPFSFSSSPSTALASPCRPHDATPTPTPTPTTTTSQPQPSKEKRSRLSVIRLLSTRSTNRRQSRIHPRQPHQVQPPPPLPLPASHNHNNNNNNSIQGGLLLKEVDLPTPPPISSSKMEKEIDEGRGGGGDDDGVVEVRVTGRAWMDEGDNESLFCY